MEKIIKIHDDNWEFEDIKENVEWSQKQPWEFKKYENRKDHDHCLICYWPIYATDNSKHGHGYFFGDSTWLCLECYDKFIK